MSISYQKEMFFSKQMLDPNVGCARAVSIIVKLPLSWVAWATSKRKSHHGALYHRYSNQKRQKAKVDPYKNAVAMFPRKKKKGKQFKDQNLRIFSFWFLFTVISFVI